MSIAGSSSQRGIGLVLLFVGGLATLPANHGVALGREESRRAFGEGERCGLALDNGTTAVSLLGDDVAEGDVIVADLEFDGESTAIASGTVRSPVSGSWSGGVRVRKGSQQLVGFVVNGRGLATVERVVVSDGSRLCFRQAHVCVELMEVCMDAERRWGDNGLSFVGDGVGGCGISVC